MDIKSEDINIRIEKKVKEAFKKKCLKEKKSMSEKLVEFILSEIK